ncbi:MAG: hypothetical protein ACOC38_10605 [Promethearchaeia archaeon]
MTTVKNKFEQTPEDQTPLSKEYLAWAKEARKRAESMNLPAPPFSIYRTLFVIQCKDGVVLAIHHSNDMAMVYSRKMKLHDKSGSLVPMDIHKIKSNLLSSNWDLSRTTLFFLEWEDEMSFEPLWNQYIKQMEGTWLILQALGSEDVQKHLRESHDLIQSNHPSDWGNAKAQARKALEALSFSITGSTKVKNLASGLVKKDLISKTEADWLKRFESLLGTTYSLASRKGAHKPDPVYLEAKFCVNIAHEVVNYVVSLILHEKGIHPESWPVHL